MWRRGRRQAKHPREGVCGCRANPKPAAKKSRPLPLLTCTAPRAGPRLAGWRRVPDGLLPADQPRA
eukprot:5932002-Lingulodinium_polyedra.AAC.1